MNDSNMTPDDWEAQLIDYTLGVMELAEAAAFEEGLEECRRHVRLAREYGATAGWLGAAVQPAEPPEGHKGRLMSIVQATPQVDVAVPAVAVGAVQAQPLRPELGAVPVAEAVESEKVTDIAEYRARRAGNALPMLATVAAVVALLLGLWGWTSFTDKQYLQQHVNIPAGYTAFSLPPQPGSEGLNMIALYDPSKSDVALVASGLQPLPPEQVYELWFLPKSGDPVAAGVFRPDEAGKATHSAIGPQTLADYSGLAVTVEPSPGVAAPTGKAVAAGTFATP
jgi:anti-sigma-K factor RskA